VVLTCKAGTLSLEPYLSALRSGYFGVVGSYEQFASWTILPFISQQAKAMLTSKDLFSTEN
jgi:hypothetical protein